MQENCTTAHAQYLDNGYDPIPLKPLSKLPLSKGWQDRQPLRQWHNAPKDSNIGLRAGNGKAFIDCDTKNDPETTGNVTRWLEGLGITAYPIVRTPSGGAHVYVTLAGVLLGSKRNLSKKIGAGEFRYGPGAYVGAWPSVIEGGRTYQIIGGDIARLPTLDIRDIETLVNLNETLTAAKPVPQMSILAHALANGQGLERYKSRSEAEVALVLSLINSGFDFPQVMQVFDTYPVFGKYAELRTRNAKRAEAYLLHTFNNARDFSQHESPTRRTIRELQDMAECAAWGRATDKLVFLAHTQIAYKVGRFEYAASSRDLALEAGLASNDTAIKATRRLVSDELLILREKSAAIFAHRYALQVDKIAHFLTSGFLGSVRECPSPSHSQVVQDGLVLDLDKLETADAFRNGKGRLGRRSGQVYKLLFTGSLANSDIAKRTGASLKTVKRVLKKLSAVKDYKTGEILQMVSRDEAGRWHSNVVDLEVVEAIYGTRGAREKQRMNYERERRDHARSLELGMLDGRR